MCGEVLGWSDALTYGGRYMVPILLNNMALLPVLFMLLRQTGASQRLLCYMAAEQ